MSRSTPIALTYVRSRMRAPDRLVTADARQLVALPIPHVRLAITSPPYSSPGDPEEALSAYRDANPGYDRYLADLQAGVPLGRVAADAGWLAHDRGGEPAPP